jgi:hypothetical protein
MAHSSLSDHLRGLNALGGDMNAVFGVGGGPLLDARTAAWTDDGQPAPAAAAALVAAGLETYALAQVGAPSPQSARQTGPKP